MTFYQIIMGIWTFIRQYSPEEQGKLWNATFEWAFRGAFLDETQLGVSKDAYALYLTITTMIIPKGKKQ